MMAAQQARDEWMRDCPAKQSGGRSAAAHVLVLAVEVDGAAQALGQLLLARLGHRLCVFVGVHLLERPPQDEPRAQHAQAQVADLPGAQALP